MRALVSMVIPGNMTSVALDLEARLAKSGLDKGRREADRVRIVEDALQQIPGGEWRLSMRIVHHEVVDEDEPAGWERVEGSPGEDGDVPASDGAPDIGHEH